MDGKTIQDLLAVTVEKLRALSATPRLDAEVLLSHVLGWSRAHLLAERTYVPNSEQVAAFQRLVERRADLEPVAYLTGHREFYGVDILVDPRVLIPRPETELLVERAIQAALERQRSLEAQQQPPLLRIADVGTGSGAMAIALAIHLAEARIYATDISEAALQVARMNVARNRMLDRVTLLQGDLLAPLPEQVDLIVSNPPYTILDQIDVDVYRYQPHLALDGGAQGVELYQRLLDQAPRWLRAGGVILMEIGATQATAVSTLVRTTFPSARITLYHDLAGRDRVVAVQT